MKKIDLYKLSVYAFFIIFPIAFIVTNTVFFDGAFIEASFKWAVFFIIGCRLFTAGLFQAVKPSFTAQNIFEVNDEKALPLVRELGFANICIGLLGILSLPFDGMRISAAIVGGIYFAFAGIMHIFRKPTNKTEIFAMISDLYAVVVLAVFFFMSI